MTVKQNNNNVVKALYSKNINNIQGKILHVFIKYIKVNEEKMILRASGGNLLY